MPFWTEESFWGTDGDTAVKETEKKKRARDSSVAKTTSTAEMLE